MADVVSFSVLDNSIIDHVDLTKVKFIAANSTGGMGYPGVLMLFVEGNPTQVFAGTDFNELTLTHTVKAQFIHDTRCNAAWHYKNMGAGNTLYIHASALNAFEKNAGNMFGPDLYRIYSNIIFESLGHSRDECKTETTKLNRFLLTQVFAIPNTRDRNNY